MNSRGATKLTISTVPVFGTVTLGVGGASQHSGLNPLRSAGGDNASSGTFALVGSGQIVAGTHAGGGQAFTLDTAVLNAWSSTPNWLATLAPVAVTAIEAGHNIGSGQVVDAGDAGGEVNASSDAYRLSHAGVGSLMGLSYFTTVVSVSSADSFSLSTVSGTANITTQDKVLVKGNYVSNDGSDLLVATVEPVALDKKLAIRELNRQFEGWTPVTNTQAR